MGANLLILGKWLSGIGNRKTLVLHRNLVILLSNRNDNNRQCARNLRMKICLFPERGLGETALFGIEKGGFPQYVVLKRD